MVCALGALAGRVGANAMNERLSSKIIDDWVAVTVTVAVGVRDGAMVGVIVWVAVAVSVTIGAAVSVGVIVLAMVALGATVGVSVLVTAIVGVSVRVAVIVGVNVLVAAMIGVIVRVAVCVGVIVLVGVNVGVAVMARTGATGALHDQPLPLIELNDKPVGKVSVRMIGAVVAPLPVLVTRNVNVAFAPLTKSPVCDLVICKTG